MKNKQNRNAAKTWYKTQNKGKQKQNKTKQHHAKTKQKQKQKRKQSIFGLYLKSLKIPKG